MQPHSSTGERKVGYIHLTHVQQLTNADIDPEDDPFKQRDSEDERDGEETPELGGREHYETVGKSKLRKPEQPRLDKKYGGIAVSRNALEEADDTDPFAPVDDDADEDPFAVRTRMGDSDETSGSGDSEADDASLASGDESMDGDEENQPPAIKRSRKPLANGVRHEDAEAGSDASDIDADSASSQHSSDDEQDDSDSDSSVESEEQKPSRNSSTRDKLKALNAAQSSESALVSSLAASSIDQARKGAAVQQQQTAFDRLLDSRIKLQKAVTISNDLPEPSEEDTDISTALSKAEAAALSLWSTIDSIRCSILSTQPNPKKRKLSALSPTPTTPLTALQTHAQTLESHSLPHRHTTLDHWSTRTRPASAAPSTSRSSLTTSTTDPSTSLSTILQTYLHSTLPKLLPPTQQPTPTSYDDTPFYQSLLTSLIASRTNASAAISSTTTSSTTHPQRRNNISQKKNVVDTKASKGRKIRYTVHEKLQNFMAPEDRSTWSEEGRREFFGSLFGQVVREGPEAVGDQVDRLGGDADEVQDGEESALRLFRRTAVA